jgi:hypothetical protein
MQSDWISDDLLCSTRDEICNDPVTGVQPKTPDLLSWFPLSVRTVSNSHLNKTKCEQENEVQ